MPASVERPSLEQPPCPHTKIGYFFPGPRSAGRKMVPSLISGSEFVSTTTSCEPLPFTFRPADFDAVQVPVNSPPVPPVGASPPVPPVTASPPVPPVGVSPPVPPVVAWPPLPLAVPPLAVPPLPVPPVV